MATVTKCDICGEIYESHPTGETLRLEIDDRVNDPFTHIRIPAKKMDCCLECTKKVLGFVDVLKQYGDNHVLIVGDMAEQMIREAEGK